MLKPRAKASIEKLKNRTTWKTYDEVKNLNGFGGVLADDTILIDIDDSDQSEILMNIVEDCNLTVKSFVPVGENTFFSRTALLQGTGHTFSWLLVLLLI